MISEDLGPFFFNQHSTITHIKPGGNIKLNLLNHFTLLENQGNYQMNPQIWA